MGRKVFHRRFHLRLRCTYQMFFGNVFRLFNTFPETLAGLLTSILIFSSDSGCENVANHRSRLQEQLLPTSSHKFCLKQFKQGKPDLAFCFTSIKAGSSSTSHRRSSSADVRFALWTPVGRPQRNATPAVVVQCNVRLTFPLREESIESVYPHSWGPRSWERAAFPRKSKKTLFVVCTHNQNSISWINLGQRDLECDPSLPRRANIKPSAHTEPHKGVNLLLLKDN